jgi:2-dehydropantoate 2-reductase
MPEHFSVAVLGPGGVGGLLAALLARDGASVQVLASEPTSLAIAERGLRVESTTFGDIEVPVRSATRLEGPVDAVLVTVKSTQLRDALERVPPSLLGDGLMVPFLNGIDHVDLLRSLYPPSNVAPATMRVETVRVDPGVIRHTSPFALIDIAANDENRDRVERLAARMAATGLTVRVRDDETSMLWDKLAILAPMALLTTHERANVGTIRTRRRDEALAMIAEVAAVAAADGSPVDSAAVAQMFEAAPETMESSMQRDQAAGRPLELDAIGGAVVRRAEQYGVDVPVTARLVNELRNRA